MACANSRHAYSLRPATPNVYNYLSLTKYFNSDWFDPKTGLSAVGKFPSNMVGRNRFNGPGAFNFDLGI